MQLDFRQNLIDLSDGSATVRKGPLEYVHHSGPTISRNRGPILLVRRLAPMRSPHDKYLAVRQVTTFEGFRVFVIIDAHRRQGRVGIPVGPNPIKYEQTDC